MFPATRRRTLGSALLIALALAAFPLPSLAPKVAHAHDVKAGGLAIGHPWARATAASAKVGALYLTVANNGTEADRLTGISTDIAEHCELHLSDTSGGVMVMRAIESMAIPPGGTATFAPQGAHVMLMGLKGALAKGSTFTATLHFEKAGDVAIEVAVQGIGDLQPAD